jgi:hypothetical protein
MCRPLSTLSRHRDRSVPNSLAALVLENSALPLTVAGMLLSVAMVKGKGSVTTCCGPYRKDFILNYLYCGKTANSLYYQTRLFSFLYTLFVTLVSKR